MGFVTSKDGTEIFYKDWGTGQPIMFHHGWPLSADDWDLQMLFFVQHGFRVIAHDRRGHGRSAQVATGHDMDHYADDAAAVVQALDLQGVTHVGHSTGGGEVVRYLTRHGTERAAKAVLISAVPPLMLRTAANPGGVPQDVFDGIRQGLATNRQQTYVDFTLPFYGYNRPGAPPQEGVQRNWWRQGMMGSILAHYEGVRAFSETDFTEELTQLALPVLVMHGDDDQIVPIANAALRSAELIPGAQLKVYTGFPHGMPTTHAAQLNADLLAFIRGS